MVASPWRAVVARECVEKFGDLKKPEAVIGTGPWMLESYKPNVAITMVRHPGYFVPGLPYIDRVELVVDEDNASRMAAFLAGRYDLGWEFPGQINRTDWVQIKDRLRQTRPSLRTAEFASNVVNDLSMRTDQCRATSGCARRSRWRWIGARSSSPRSRGWASSTARSRRP
jgi:ABC-type transport system substrate-binding protein